MIQPIYTSVSNADVKPCGKKGHLIKSEPIPLLRNNYLGEYRTELERAKVRKNLGIADEQSLLWGNIDGTIEAQKDLVQYIEQKWTYTSDVAENINTVKDALDYALFFISQYEANTEEIDKISIPYGKDFGGMNTDGPPCTLNGFTAARNGEVVPEWTLDARITPNEGAELHKVVNGKDTVVALFYGEHFVKVKGKQK